MEQPKPSDNSTNSNKTKCNRYILDQVYKPKVTHSAPRKYRGRPMSED